MLLPLTNRQGLVLETKELSGNIQWDLSKFISHSVGELINWTTRSAGAVQWWQLQVNIGIQLGWWFCFCCINWLCQLDFLEGYPLGPMVEVQVLAWCLFQGLGQYLFQHSWWCIGMGPQNCMYLATEKVVDLLSPWDKSISLHGTGVRLASLKT